MRRVWTGAILAITTFSLVATVQAQPAPAAFESPTLAAVRLNVADLARSEHFYRETFSLPAAQSYGPRERVLSLPGAGAPRITLMQSDQAQPRNGGLALIVVDIDAVMRTAPTVGGRVIAAPQAVNIGGAARIGHIEDPDGVAIEVIQVVSAARP